MAFTCQNCGVTAEMSSKLCNPTSEVVDSDNKFCGTSADLVCQDQLKKMKYSCDACGSQSVDAENLCNPSQMN